VYTKKDGLVLLALPITTKLLPLLAHEIPKLEEPLGPMSKS